MANVVGVLNVNKPAGLTSRDTVDRIERLVRPARAGHAGTLDPLATGVLVICVGQATRLIQYIQRLPKTYQATFLLGQRSDTDDVEGNIVAAKGVADPGRETVERELTRFVGDVEQRPPAHSAVKLAGRRAYHLARRGVQVEMKPRAVAIHAILMRRYEFPVLELEVECGSGTYIRALARDVGEALGIGAVLSTLQRTAIGGYRVETAVSIDEVNATSLSQHIQPALTAVTQLPLLKLTDAQLFELRHGRPIMREWVKKSNAGAEARIDEQKSILRKDADIAAVDFKGRLAAILYEKLPGELWPRLYFNRSDT